MINTNSKIMTCATSGCGWTCCDFHDNYIVLLPGEWERAQRKGVSTRHLHITDNDYFGGKKVVCTANNKANCDGGLKPKDCQYYPAFPVANAFGTVTEYIRGAKCPLKGGDIYLHLLKVSANITKLVEKNPGLADFLGQIQMVGYEAARPFPLIPLGRIGGTAPVYMRA